MALQPDARGNLGVTAIAGPDKGIGPAIKLLGVDPTAITYSMAAMRPDDLASYRSGRLERVVGGLHTLLLGRFPRPICIAVERALKVSRRSTPSASPGR